MTLFVAIVVEVPRGLFWFVPGWPFRCTLPNKKKHEDIQHTVLSQGMDINIIKGEHSFTIHLRRIVQGYENDESLYRVCSQGERIWRLNHVSLFQKGRQ